MLSSKYLRTSGESGEKGRISSLIGSAFSSLEAVYTRVLTLALRRPWATVAAAAAVFVGSFGLLAMVDKEFMPDEDRGEFAVPFEMPSGTSLDETKRASAQLRDELATVPGVSSVFTTIGGGSQGQVNKGNLHVNLVDRGDRNFTTVDAIEYVRARLGERPPATLSVERVGAIEGGGFRSMEVQFNVRGHDFDELNGAAQALIEKLREQGGYVDLDTTYRGGKPELAVNIDRDRAAALGVPVATIAMAIRTLIAGAVVTDLPQGGERLDVRVRVEDALRRGPDDVAGIRVRGASGQLVELSNLVELEPRTGPAQIERQDRQRQITILANLEGKALGEAVNEVEKVASDVVPTNLTTDWAGMGDLMIQAFGYMVQALILAFILVYLILAAQFESLVHPFTIMMAVPLSMAGAFGALLIVGMSLNVFSMIGLIMLMGLVTKNAVLLVDYTNTLRRTGLSRKEALLKAGPVRLRPILMTTAATVFGMLPVAMATSLGGEVRAPMAIAIMGGLISSTALTLLVVPAVYDLMDRFSRTKDKDVGYEADALPGLEHAASSET